MSQDSSKEREVLMIMRKVLAQIVKDTTPPSRALKHPLSDQTIQDIRNCLGLISARERELADLAGIAMEKPYYADDKPAAEVVSINRIGRSRKDDEA
jgi:hypothetical protein